MAAYTPDVHRLYVDVVHHHEVNLEELPYTVFEQLADCFGEQLGLSIVRDGSRVAAFSWSLRYGNIYHNLIVGLDYGLNECYDLYFNLMIRDVAHGMTTGARRIVVGQTADVFKSRLGAIQKSRCFYIRGIRPVTWMLRMASPFIFPHSEKPPHRDLYRNARAVQSQSTVATADSIAT